ncbi:STAS domain-containing protein [Streptosporangium sandarakinum]|uniref:Anti-sigma factor antagonist n=1 Tax=Streptosporangium sandarakinum TaxID=1260955 RepID=A0A852UYV3_9ACTN|nr:STAS domain-containing protein [Streptosporangium sandarakinum]NYF40214.1 anti-anti-sigma factor [Streptosporangium sandarakinum]
MVSQPQSATALTISSQPRDGAVVLRAHGELDMGSAPVLRERLRQATERPAAPALVVDLVEVSFCDSVGMSELVLALHRSEAEGLRLALSGVHGSLERLLWATGLHNVFDIHPTCDDALRAVTAPGRLKRRP